MSIWTQDDVDQLKPKNGGSNKNAEAKYFAHYDEQRLPRPRKGDDHTVWKDFVQQVYNEKRFYDDQGRLIGLTQRARLRLMATLALTQRQEEIVTTHPQGPAIIVLLGAQTETMIGTETMMMTIGVDIGEVVAS